MRKSRAYCTAFLAFLLFAAGSLAPLSAHALVQGELKHLAGRLGLGFTNQIAVDADRTIPALSTKFYPSNGTAIGLGVGFDTRSSASTLAMGLKGYKNIFFESNMIFYVGLGLAYVNRVGSKLQGSAFLGTEFFFSQLPSLGLSFEAGLRGDNMSGAFAIRTIGDSFLTAGMHFYL